MATEEPIVPTQPAAEEPEPATAKKASAPRKRKNPPQHPPYFEMIKDAIVTLKERNGSSLYAIAKFIEAKHKNLPPTFKKLLLTLLKKFVAGDKLVRVKGSYKLPSAKAAAESAPAKFKPDAKSKPAAKKAPAKKKRCRFCSHTMCSIKNI